MTDSQSLYDENFAADGMDSTPNITPRKRKAKARTPMVDDEVRRSARFRANVDIVHIRPDNEPRRKKGASKKSVSFTTVEDLKTAIISSELEDIQDDEVVEPIQARVLADLGTSFCGIPPMEIEDAGLLQTPKD